MTDRIKRMADLSNRVNIYPDTITPEFDRAKPGKHSNPPVRVGGYSDRFVTLSDKLRNEIISRTRNAIG